jgi:hypothetical protein
MAATPSSYTRFQTSTQNTRTNMLVSSAPLRRQPAARPQAPALALHNLFTLPKEPEDARLTGGTRSLDRRLLALNVAGTLGKRRPASERIAPPVRSAVA